MRVQPTDNWCSNAISALHRVYGNRSCNDAGQRLGELCKKPRRALQCLANSALSYLAGTNFRSLLSSRFVGHLAYRFSAHCIHIWIRRITTWVVARMLSTRLGRDARWGMGLASRYYERRYASLTCRSEKRDRWSGIK